jgi:hypothetical protein
MISFKRFSEIIANTIKDVWTIKFKNEIILSLVYQII